MLGFGASLKMMAFYTSTVYFCILLQKAIHPITEKEFQGMGRRKNQIDTF